MAMQGFPEGRWGSGVMRESFTRQAGGRAGSPGARPSREKGGFSRAATPGGAGLDHVEAAL